MQSEIKNRARKQQILSYAGCKWGKISFSDIDAIMEIRNKVYIVVEVKYLDAPVPTGQRILLEHLNQALAKAGKYCLTIVASHSVDDTAQDVDLATCQVKQIYINGHWINKSVSVKKLMDNYLRLSGIFYSEV